MVVAGNKRAVGVFSTRSDAEEALHELRNSGFAMNQVSVIARDVDDNDRIAGAEVRDKVGNKADEGASVGAISGGALGGLTGLLVGLGTLAIPGIGPIMLAGAAATTIATTLAGVGIGAVAGGLIGALIGLGIPEERARVYNERVERGHYLVIVDGTDAEIAIAENILRRRGIEEFGVYDQPNGVRATSEPVVGAGMTRQAIGQFHTSNDAEAAINDLRNAGFPLSQITLIHKEPYLHENFRNSGVNVSDRFDAMRLGIPEPHAHFYETQVKGSDYVMILTGTEDELNRVMPILNRHGLQILDVYSGNTPVQAHKRAVGVFPHRRDAEMALTELRDAGFPMNQVSLIAKDADHNHNPVAGVEPRTGVGNKADEGAKAGAVTGGALGGLGGLLVGLGALAIPGVGPVIAGGAAATALATTLAGGAIGTAAGGLVGGLVGLGIPENRARVYGDRLNRGDHLVIVDGTEDEIRHAEAILKRRGVEEYGIYDATDIHNLQRPNYDRDVRYETPDVIPANTNYSTDVNHDPAVIIIDHRKEEPI